MAWRFGQERLRLTEVLLMGFCLVFTAAEDPRECREQEYKDQSGSCVACKQCDAGHELSKECGFGYGEEARCEPCRPGRFKEDGGLQKCKPCLDCALANRFQKGNCSASRNAVCGDCLPGFYRKTKLSGFQDMECVPCGDLPSPYEPHCIGRVNLVPLQSTASSPRDVALAAVICSALAAVLLALLILCAIYCKRQLLENKPAALACSQDGPYNGAELSRFDRRRHHELPHPTCGHCHLVPNPTRTLACSQDGPYNGAELSRFDRRRHHELPHPTCGHCHLVPNPTRNPLTPALCCDETCNLGQNRDDRACQTPGSHSEGITWTYFA